MFSIWGKTQAGGSDAAAQEKYYYSASSGHILSADSSGFVIPNLGDVASEKQDFIPKAVAVSKVKDLVQDSTRKHDQYQQNLQKLNDFYQKALEDSKTHYESLIQDLKVKALRHVEVQKQLRSIVEERLNKELKVTEERLDELRDSMANLTRNYQDEVKMLKSKIGDTEKALQLSQSTSDNNLRDSVSQLVMHELLTAVERRGLEEEYREKIRSINGEVDNMKQNFADTVNEERKNKIESINQLQTNLEIRRDCEDVLNVILHTIEINDLRDNLTQVAQLQRRISELDELVRKTELEVIATREELQNAQTSQSELTSRTDAQLQEIERLTAEFEEEKRHIIEDNETHVSHLKSKFNTVLKKMKSEKEALEVRMCLMGVIASIVDRSQEETMEASKTLLKQEEFDKMMKINNEDNQTALKKSQLQFDEKLKKIKQKFSGVLSELKSKNERLQVELSLATIVSEVVARESKTYPGVNEADKSLVKQVEDLKMQLEAARDALQQRSTSSPRSPRIMSSAAPSIVESQELQALQKEIQELKLVLKRLYQNIAVADKELEPVVQEREKCKIEIKDWTRQFQEANGREPDNADKNQIRDKYQRYKISSTKSKEIETKLSDQNREREELESKLKDSEAKYQQMLLMQKKDHDPNVGIVQSNVDTNVVPANFSNAEVAIFKKAETVDVEVQVATSELRANVMKKAPSDLHNVATPNVNAVSATEITSGPSKEQMEDMKRAHEDQLEQLEDQLFAVKEEAERLKMENHKLAEDKSFVANQLEVLIKEKRTDVLKRYEEDLERLQKSEEEKGERVIALTAERHKLEMRVSELKERAERAEQELKDRDLREQQQANPEDEKLQLKGQISKQRDQIILKSKAATAGWDAAANADEKLENEVLKALQKGAKEEKEKHKSDLEAVHKSLEEKETRITDLLVQIAEMEMKVKSSNDAQESMKAQVESMKLEVADAISGIQLMAAAAAAGGAEMSGDGSDLTMPPSAAELERAQEQLDQAQEELVALSERCDRLESELEMTRKRNRIYERLATMTGLTSGIAVAAGKGAKKEEEPINYDLNDVVERVKKAILKVNYYLLIHYYNRFNGFHLFKLLGYKFMEK